MSNEVTAKSYTLRTEQGNWLGQVVLTSDGMYSSITDYGNFAYPWRHFGEGDFRKFLITMNEPYFASKMYQGVTYLCHGKKFKQACNLYSEKIFPVLVKVLKEEIELETKTT